MLSSTKDHEESHSVPYFRYFGPTAIVPGFKRVVVSVPDRRHIAAIGNSPHQSENGLRHVGELPIYNPDDPSPVPELILKLVDTFFLRLGCNYRFLQKDKFERIVKAKTVEPILVNAVCAIAAPFSHGLDYEREGSEHSRFYAGRAKSLTVDTFACPSVAAVQACILMAYESIGANLDSALWMYVGLASRMAVDLGLQTFDGVRHQGENNPWDRRMCNGKPSESYFNENGQGTDNVIPSPDEQKEAEQERVDTLWALFMLDRVVSSSTGRPAAFRDEDCELPLPLSTIKLATGWPDPFSDLIRIIRLYGQASDILNKLKNANNLAQEKMKQLVQVEDDLVQLYQKQATRLHFSAYNFQEYIKAGQGTTFILLHLWFHALIIILHQPTLLIPSGGLSWTYQLLPNSHELSMSSAKTISDILAFAELIEPKSFTSNPFTSQPVYIAACAFLRESAVISLEPASPEVTPPPTSKAEPNKTHHSRSNSSGDTKSFKYSLLASAANWNYQRCYKSLQRLHTDWAGVKYILTALDQKSKGIWDCETYTVEEYESTKLPQPASLTQFHHFGNPSSPSVPPIAWSLAGTTNSPNSSLTLLYHNMNTGTPKPTLVQQPPPAPASAAASPGNMIYDPIRQRLPEAPAMFPPAYLQPNVSPVRCSVHPSLICSLLPTSPLPTNQNPRLFRFLVPPDGTCSSILGNDGKVQMPAGLDQENPLPPPPPPPPPPAVHSYTPSSHYSSTYEPSIIGGASQASTVDSAPVQQHDTANSASNANTGEYPHEFAQSGPAWGTYSCLWPIMDVFTLDTQEIDLGSLDSPDVFSVEFVEWLFRPSHQLMGWI